MDFRRVDRLALRPALRVVLALLSLAGTGAWACAGAVPAHAEGCAGSGSSSCPYVAAQVIGRRAEGVLRFPEAVAVDTIGNVYVADQLSYVVQKFTAGGTLEAEWGSYGGGHGQFGPIGGLATDAGGNVYVVDSSHNRIQKFDPAGNFLTSWGHRGSELGAFNFGSSQDPTQPPGGGIAVAGSYVYVADSGNDRIERFNLGGGEPIQFGSYGSGPGQLSYPRGLAANEGEVIVADDDNHRLQKFDPSGNFLEAMGSRGSGPGQFGFPYGVALDAAGNAYVADDINHRIVKVGPQLQFLGAWGGFGSKPGQLAFPRAIASDPAGDTYVADTANSRVQVFDPQGNYLRTIGASGRGPGQLTGPRGLAVDPSGRLLVSDTVDNRIEVFAPTGTFATQWTSTGGARKGLAAPAGIGVDPRGSVYVADSGNARLVRLWGDGTYLGELAGPAAVGGAQVSAVSSAAVAAGSGLLYVADTGHNRVLVYGPEGALRARLGAHGGDGSSGRGPGEYNRPGALALDAAGDVYVADTANNRIVKLSPEGAPLAEWGSRGSTDGRFRSPTGVAVDAAGRVYVLDGENNRVQVFDAGGRMLEKWGLRGAGLGFFSQPTAIAIGCAGDVYVADTNNNRVERFVPAAPAGSGCVSASAWPPPLDVAPVLSVRLPRSAGVLARRALALTISCERGCKVLARATLAPYGRRGAVPLQAAARSLPRDVAGHLRLRMGARAYRRLRGALGRARLMRAQVTIVAAGPTGKRTTLRRSYIVGR